MDGNGVARLEVLAGRQGRVLGVHGEVPANGDQDQVRAEIASIEAEVAKQPRVPHVVDLEAVFQFDDEAGRLAPDVDFRLLGLRIGPAVFGTVLGAGHGDANTLAQGLDAAALVEAGGEFLGQFTQRDQGVVQAGRSVKGDLEPFGQRGSVAHMVAMGVGDQGQIDLAEGGEILVLGLGLGVLGEKGGDHDYLARDAGDLEGGLAEPKHHDLAFIRDRWGRQRQGGEQARGEQAGRRAPERDLGRYH